MSGASFHADADRAIMRNKFQEWDTDGDGFISREELGQVFQKLGWGEDEVEALWDIADVNGDGNISYSEFIDWLLADETDLLALVPIGRFNGNVLCHRFNGQDNRAFEGRMVFKDEAHSVVRFYAHDGERVDKAACDVYQMGHAAVEGDQVWAYANDEEDFMRSGTLTRMGNGEGCPFMGGWSEVLFDADVDGKMDVCEVPVNEVHKEVQGCPPPEEVDIRAEGWPEIVEVNGVTFFTEDPLLNKTCEAAFMRLSRPWTDPEFGPYRSSLGDPVNEFDPDYIDWRRPTKGEFLIGTSLGAGDLCQGEVGDCWLMGAVAALTFSDPDAVKDCISSHGALNPFGVYTARFFIDGRPLWLLIDDLIPAKQYSPYLPVFCHSGEEGELWPVYLEKAFAKWAGSYANLSGDVILEDQRKQKFSSAIKGFNTDATYYVGDNDESLAFAGRYHRGKLSLEGLEELLSAGAVAFTAKGGHEKNPEDWKDDGLIPRHAYSILGVFQTSIDSGPLQLVRLRNPWGKNGEWTGDWSDSSPLWEQNPEIAEEVGHTIGLDAYWSNDGVFFMTWQDMESTMVYVRMHGNDLPDTA